MENHALKTTLALVFSFCVWQGNTPAATMAIQLSSIVISPNPCTTHTWQTATFNAVAKDGTGAGLNPQPTFKWTISNNRAIDSTTGNFAAGSTGGGPYTIIATATVNGITKSGTATVLVLRPVTITSPRQGATYHVGDTLTIRWIRQAGTNTAGIDIQFSSNAGRMWSTILDNEMIHDGDSVFYNQDPGTFKWPIPGVFTTPIGVPVNCVSTQCRIQLDGPYDLALPTEDFSGVFTIANITAVRLEPSLSAVSGAHTHDTPVLVYDLRGRLVMRAINVHAVNIKTKTAGFLIAMPGQQEARRVRIGQ